jgi:hypothetical protein
MEEGGRRVKGGTEEGEGSGGVGRRGRVEEGRDEKEMGAEGGRASGGGWRVETGTKRRVGKKEEGGWRRVEEWAKGGREKGGEPNLKTSQMDMSVK